MIRLNVFFEVKEDAKADELKALCNELVEKSLTDEGNIAYDTFESATRPDIFMICETWQDDASLKKHMAADHFKLYVGQLETLGSLKLEQFEF